MAFKSDVSAKQAFVERLLQNGYESAEVKAEPADVMAVKDGAVWYFEIKLTDHSDKCFGAATLTEWEQAFKDPEHFRFVVAIRDEAGSFEFRQFTPAEFLAFSTIPPFKVYFNIDFSGRARRESGKGGKRKPAIKLTRDNFAQMNKLFKSMRDEQERGV